MIFIKSIMRGTVMNNLKIILILLLFLFISKPSLSKDKVVKSLGLGVGVCLPQGGWDPGSTITAQGDFGEAIKYIYLLPYLSYSSAGKTEQINQNPEGLSSEK
jgi:hypothetical protein